MPVSGHSTKLAVGGSIVYERRQPNKPHADPGWRWWLQVKPGQCQWRLLHGVALHVGDRERVDAEHAVYWKSGHGHVTQWSSKLPAVPTLWVALRTRPESMSHRSPIAAFMSCDSAIGTSLKISVAVSTRTSLAEVLWTQAFVDQALKDPGVLASPLELILEALAGLGSDSSKLAHLLF